MTVSCMKRNEKKKKEKNLYILCFHFRQKTKSNFSFGRFSLKLRIQRSVERVKVGMFQHLLGADALSGVVHHSAGQQVKSNGIQRRNLLLQRTSVPMRKRCLIFFKKKVNKKNATRTNATSLAKPCNLEARTLQAKHRRWGFQTP